MRICHIVPSVPPEYNGLGDYAFQLCRHWPEPRPGWEILARRLPEGAKEHWPEASMRTFESSGRGLADALGQSSARTVVLHYVGYAYAKRGAPLWLPGTLAAWKANTGGRLIVIFHELYAVGPPWSSPFWLLPLQMRVAKRLAAIGDAWTTSCPDYLRVLRERLRVDMSKGGMIPIGTNIEPVRGPKPARPWPSMLKIVVFGLPLTRLRTLRCHRNLLGRVRQRGLIEKLVLIGRSEAARDVQEATNAILDSIGCETATGYDLEPADISALLLDSHVGLLHNSCGTMTKSGVFAAYCTHGLVTVVPQDGLCERGPFVVSDDAAPDASIEALVRGDGIPTEEDRRRLLFETVSARFAEVCSKV